MSEADFPALGAQPVLSKKQQQSQAKPKKKKIALDDFLAETGVGGGSWADEMDAMPTGPTAKDSGDVGGWDPQRRGARPDRPDFGDRPVYERAEVPLPTAPPYTAYLGNMNFDTTENDIADFFAPATISSTRIVQDREGKRKGFAYVEFTTLDDLKASLGKSGFELVGRTVRVSVAEPPRSQADDDRVWRREGPLPPLGDDDRRRGGMGMRQTSDRIPVDDNDWTGARGSKFVPSEAPPSRGGMRREHSGASSNRTFDNFERGANFVPSEPPSATRSHFDRSGGPPPPAPIGEADTASTWRRTSPLPPPTNPNHLPSPRSFSNEQSPPDSPAIAAPAVPAQRKKLQLAPRSTTLASDSAAASPDDKSITAGMSKMNPFGGAAPVNTAERERKMEERMQKRAKEVKEQSTQEKAAVAAKQIPDRGAWRRPSATNTTSPAPSSSNVPSSQTQTQPAKPSTSNDSDGNLNKSLRKEGFSFASAAGSKAANEDL